MYNTIKLKKQKDFLKELKSFAISQTKLFCNDCTRDDDYVINNNKLSCEDKMISTTFTPTQAIQIQKNLESVKEAFERISLIIQNEKISLDYKEEIIYKALNYNIPFNAQKDNIETLESKIDEFEFLLNTAKLYGIYWDSTEYDPIALQQEIDYYETQEKNERNLMYLDFINSISIRGN